MKNILMAACCAVVMFAANNAKALECELNLCAQAVNADSGVTALSCFNNNTTPSVYTACGCQESQTGCLSNKFVSSGSSCGGGWTTVGYHVDGRKCCARLCAKEEVQAEAAQVGEVVTDREYAARLNEVFEANLVGRDDPYYGYANGLLRSPTGGRANAYDAKLDVCLDYVDADAIPGADNAEKWGNCVGSTYGCGASGKNEHCQATGTNDGATVSAAVCKDRCDCKYSQGTCANL